MALPFLPATEILGMFEQLRTQAKTTALRNLMAYIHDTWLTDNVWPPSCWSVYMKAVRTNNDVEGWHNGLNRRASGKCQLPLYLLINLLHREAELSSLHARLVSDSKLQRIQRNKYKKVQAKLFGYWEEYITKERSTYQLLKACSNLNGPVRNNK